MGEEGKDVVVCEPVRDPDGFVERFGDKVAVPGSHHAWRVLGEGEGEGEGVRVLG